MNRLESLRKHLRKQGDVKRTWYATIDGKRVVGCTIVNRLPDGTYFRRHVYYNSDANMVGWKQC